MSSLLIVLDQALNLYQMLIFAYVISSWFPRLQLVQDFRRAIEPLCEPYLAMFRKLIPSAGGFDFSPVLAIIVLSFARQFLFSAIAR